MYNRARVFPVQEFSDSPDVEMVIGVLVGLCDLISIFKLESKITPRFHTDITGVIWSSPTWINGMCTRSSCCLLPAVKNSVLLSFTISMLEAIQFCHTVLNGSDWVSLIRGENGSEWQVNLVVIGIALAFWEVPFYDLEQVGHTDGVVNSCVYYAHQTREIYQVLSYSVDLKDPEELLNPQNKTVLSKCCSIKNKEL